MLLLQCSVVVSTIVLVSVLQISAQQYNHNGRLNNQQQYQQQQRYNNQQQNQQQQRYNNNNNNNYGQQSGVPNGNRANGGNGYGKKTGYKYKEPSTTTTTPRPTRPPPIYESIIDNDSTFVTPPAAPPSPVFPMRDFITTTASTIQDGEWDIRDSVPGQPAQDYPILSSIPKTSFSCEGRIPGFYVDPETRCQVFHRCTDCSDQPTLQQESFLCPNGTQFNQQILTCDWWGNVECPGSEKFYELNRQLGYKYPDGSYAELTASRSPPTLKKVAPRIIPKSEREPLPPELRSNHFSGDAQGHHGIDSTGQNNVDNSPPPPPVPPKNRPNNNNNNNNGRPPANARPNQNQLGNRPPQTTAVPQAKGFESEKEDDSFFNDYFNEGDDNVQGAKSNIQKILSKLDSPGDLDTQEKVIGFRTGKLKSDNEQQERQSPQQNDKTNSAQPKQQKQQPAGEDLEDLSDTKPASFIVNRPPEDILNSNNQGQQKQQPREEEFKFKENESPKPAVQRLQVPNVEFEGSNEKPNKVDSRIGNQKSSNKITPPDDEYLPPTTTTQRPIYLPEENRGGYSSGGYSNGGGYSNSGGYSNNNGGFHNGGGYSNNYNNQQQNNGYLPPQNNKPNDEYLPPKNDNKPSDEYLPPKNGDSSPQELNRYVTPPSANIKESYGEPQSDSYQPVSDSFYRRPSSGYGAPQQSPTNEYSAPQQQQLHHLQLPFTIASPNIQFLSFPQGARHVVTPSPVLFPHTQYLLNL